MAQQTREQLEKQLAELEQQEKQHEQQKRQSERDSIFQRQKLYPLTELGNAKRLSLKLNGQLLYVPETHNWFVWNGVLWNEDHHNNVYQMYEQVLTELENEKDQIAGLITVEQQNGGDEQVIKSLENLHKEYANWIKSSQRVSTLHNTLSWLSSRNGMSQSLEWFDTKGHYFGVQNGVLDLRPDRFRLIQDDPKYLMTKSANVEFDPEATCPNWKSLIDKITMNDPDVAGFLQRLFGQAMLGEADKEQMVVLYGSGANGKSTIVDMLEELFGDYATVTDPDMIMNNQNSNKEYYLADLKAIRLLIMNESKRSDCVADHVVKKLVGSGPIRARYPKQRTFQYQPVMTPIILTNHRPKIKSTDHAIWRRILFYKFDYRFGDDEKIPDFRQRYLDHEKQGILNWCIDGALQYKRDGLCPPDEVLRQTEDYRKEQDAIGTFLREYYKFDDSTKKIKLSDLYDHYSRWCKDNGFYPGASQTLANDLREREIHVDVGTNNATWVYGIRAVDVHDKVNKSDRHRESPALVW